MLPSSCTNLCYTTPPYIGATGARVRMAAMAAISPRYERGAQANAWMPKTNHSIPAILLSWAKFGKLSISGNLIINNKDVHPKLTG